MLLFFTIFKQSFDKTTLQSLSHNCPSEINNALFKFGNTYASLAFFVRSFDKGKLPDPVAWRFVLSNCWTTGPLEFLKSLSMSESSGQT